MTEPLTNEKIEALASISRDQRAPGPPPMISAQIMLDEKGYVWGACPGDTEGETGCYLHAGLRLGWAPLVLHDGVILSLWGGSKAEQGFEEEGLLAFVTREGLRALAADLMSIADAAEIQP